MTVDNDRPALEQELEEALEHLTIGSKSYVFKIEPKCRICRDPTFLKMVNDMLANGMTYSFILRTLQPLNDALPEISDRVSLNSIRSHTKNHFNRDSAALKMYREIIETRALEQGVNFVEGAASALTPMAALDIIMNKGLLDIQKRNAEPVSPDTMIRAAKELQAITNSLEDDADAEELRQQFNRLLESVKKNVPEEFWRKIVSDLKGNSVDTENVQDAEVTGEIE